jgi:hypothetical protein
MSQQIQITGGAKVRNLEGVLTGTAGVVNALGINVPSGIPQLDGSGKILVSQLPNSVMEYKGTWNAATNTPTLVNGTGNQGDVYLCNVAGTVNFGAGAITFAVGDQAIYSGTIWQKAGGSTGTVTSVAITETGDALTITGSPITTSGTINIGFAGVSGQYVNGAGGLTTFPSLAGYVTAVTGTAPVVSSGGTTPAISMPVATASVDGYLDNADWTIFNNKQNAITLTTTGTSGAATLIGATLNIPNYSTALSGYVPYTGATQDVDLGAFKLNAQSLHAKGTGGLGHLGLKHQSASATASANEVSLFADSLGDLSWQNGNLYLSKFITSGNTAARSYTFPNASGTVALTSDLSSYVPYSGATANVDLGIYNMSAAYYKSTNGYVMGQGSTVGLSGSFTVIGATPTSLNIVISNTKTFLLTFPSTSRTYTYPDATGTLALTSDLGAYLPLTGGTLTGALNINLGSGTGLNVASDLVIFRASTGFATPRQITLAAGNGATTYLEAKGYGGNYITDFGIRTYNSSGTAFEVFFATSAGNVGIGTTSPNTILDVNGTINVRTNGFQFGRITTNNVSGDTGGLSFQYNSAGTFVEGMRINGGGNVGIGTSSPDAIFHVAKTGTGGLGGQIVIDNNANDTVGNTAELSFLTTNGASGTGIRNARIQAVCENAGNGATNLQFFTWSGATDTERMRITSGGVVRAIGGSKSTTSANFIITSNESSLPMELYFQRNESVSYHIQSVEQGVSYRALYLNPNGGAVYAGGVRLDTLSDIRVKDNIQPIEGALNKVLSITGKKFHLKDEQENKLRYGFIAQELEGILDEFVIQTNMTFKNNELEVENVKSIENWATSWAALLVEAIKEQQAQIEELKAMIEAK